MATEADDRRAARTFLALGVVLIVGLVVAFALPQPSVRQFPEREVVRFWHPWTAEWKDVVDEIVARFNASQERYEVVALSVPPRAADTKFVLAVTGGDPPDLMAHWTPVIPSWVDAGLLEPFDAFLSLEEQRQLRAEMAPVARKIGEYQGKLYGISIGLNLFACYYHPAHFREAGLDPDQFPETLEELFAVAEKLDRYEGRVLTRLGLHTPPISHFAPLFGDGFFDWKTGELRLATAENLRALEFLTARRQRLGYDNVVRFMAGLDRDSFAAGWPFIGGFYSITVEGQWRIEQVARYAPSLEYRTALLPPPAGGRERAGFATGNFMMIPKGAKQREGAWSFVKFWSGIENPEQAAELAVLGGWLPMLPAVAEAPAYQAYLERYPQFRTFVDLLPSDNLQTVPPVPYTIFLMDRIYRADDMATRGLLTPAEALAALERDVAHEQERRRRFGYEN
jgi:multiple sugar transport system substrate-binding protein